PVVAIGISFGAGGFGNSPWNTVGPRKLLLRSNGRPDDALEHCVRIAADPQTWHQEFKRGPAPREEHVLALVGAEGSLQVKPALLRSLPFGDGHEYRRARLGSEKIVVVLAQPALGLLKPD